MMGRRSDRTWASVEPRLRGAAAFPAAVLAVHELRYVLAFGPRADEELAAQGHAYLQGLTLPAVVLLAIAAGAFLGHVELVRARRPGGAADAAARRGFVRLWLTLALALVATYAVQESLEGLASTGHPGGVAGVFGSGGWLAVPAALAVAAALAGMLRIAAVVLARLGAPRARIAAPGSRAPRRPRAAARWAGDPLARRGAQRAPPVRACRAA